MYMHILTEFQKQTFDKKGFLIMPQMYSATDIDTLSTWVNALTSIKPELGKEMIYLDPSLVNPNEKIINRIEYFAERDAYIKSIIFGERLISIVGSLLEDQPVLFKEKLNLKLPGGGGFKPHQDMQPGWDDYAPYFISVLIALDDNLEKNGCLELAEGQHKRGWIGRRFEPLEGDELDGIIFKKYPMRAGDVAIFDCYAPHQSEPNASDKPRRNLYLTYNRLSDGNHRKKYFADKRKNYPPNNERKAGEVYDFKV